MWSNFEPTGDLIFEIGTWNYYRDTDVDPDDRTVKFWHFLQDRFGNTYMELDSAIGPYKIPTQEEVKDIIIYLEYEKKLV